MKKIPMPWIENEDSPPPTFPVSKMAKLLESFLEILRKNWSLLILILSVASLFAYRGHLGATEGDGTSRSLVGLASKTPVFKGDYLEPLAIEEVNIARASLTKNQAWGLLQFSMEQLGPDLRLRAKRDIPPRKPLQWSDIEVVREGSLKATGPRPVEIQYSKFTDSNVGGPGQP